MEGVRCYEIRRGKVWEHWVVYGANRTALGATGVGWGQWVGEGDLCRHQELWSRDWEGLRKGGRVRKGQAGEGWGGIGDTVV